jgi:hypothetical protein
VPLARERKRDNKKKGKKEKKKREAAGNKIFLIYRPVYFCRSFIKMH